jgi:hypothetical protein
MLAEQYMPASKRARLQIHAADPVLNRLLRVLLQEWGYELVEVGGAADLHIVQEGCLGPAAGSNRIGLTSAPDQAADSVAIPLSMEVLWRAMEGRLHAPPRRQPGGPHRFTPPRRTG